MHPHIERLINDITQIINQMWCYLDGLNGVGVVSYGHDFSKVLWKCICICLDELKQRHTGYDNCEYYIHDVLSYNSIGRSFYKQRDVDNIRAYAQNQLETWLGEIICECPKQMELYWDTNKYDENDCVLRVVTESPKQVQTFAHFVKQMFGFYFKHTSFYTEGGVVTSSMCLPKNRPRITRYARWWFEQEAFDELLEIYPTLPIFISKESHNFIIEYLQLIMPKELIFMCVSYLNVQQQPLPNMECVLSIGE